MLRSAILVCLGLICGACDSLYGIKSSRRSRDPLDRRCVLEALCMENIVRKAWIDGDRMLAELIMPNDLKGSTQYPVVGVHLERIKGGEFELLIEIAWINSKECDEYNSHLRRMIEDLSDRVIEKCGGL